MISVIGYEGYRRSQNAIFWATPVVRQGQSIINPTTGDIVSEDLLAYMQQERLISLLETPIVLDWACVESDLILAIVSRKDPLVKYVLSEKGHFGSPKVITKKADFFYYVFSGRPSFDEYCRRAIARITNSITEIPVQKMREELPLSAVGEPESYQNLLRLGMTLDSSSFIINALEVVFSGNTQHSRRLAEARVKTSELHLFEQFLEACLIDDKRYSIKYDNGVAKDGGMDCSVFRDIMDGLSSLHKKVAVTLRDEFQSTGFRFERTHSPRVQQVERGSAHLTFATALDSETLKQRIERFFELQAIERLIAGDLSPEEQLDSEIEKALDKILRPGPNTDVYHKPMRGTELESVGQIEQLELTQEDVISSTDIIPGVLGYQCGLVRDSKIIEIKIFPGRNILVSALDNGNGCPPSGLHQDASQLYRPAIYDLLRKISSRGKTSYFVTKATPIIEGTAAKVRSMPSCVAKNSFWLGVNAAIEWDDGDQFMLAGTPVPFPTKTDNKEKARNNANEWIVDVHSLLRNLELGQTVIDKNQWLAPARPPKTGELERILTALQHINGQGTIDLVLEKINELFGTPMQNNNTRRAIRHKEYLATINKDTHVISISNQGAVYLKIFQVLRGSISLPSEVITTTNP